MSKISRIALVVSLSLFPASVRAQSLQSPVLIGQGFLYGGNVNPPGVETDFNLFSRANLIGEVTQATFGWSNSPCPAAVKIKFFRPTPAGNPQPAFSFLTERGPFDVTEPVQTSNSRFPPVTQTVALDPPVSVRPGDIIAITNLTQCGGPTFVAQLPGPIPPFASASFSVAGDAFSEVRQPETSRPGVFIVASGNVPGLFLLHRFQVTLDATDPRTGRRTTGVPVSLSAFGGSAAGFFSLPDFTGNPFFPEITVKMVDGTSNSALGGTFWFFHAPLTDVVYTLKVDDLITGRSRSYSSVPGTSPGQLCGNVDTNAFIP